MLPLARVLPIRLVFPAILLASLSVALRAEVRCSPLFSDHMVLQRELPVPVWGDAAPGEKVKVEFAGQIREAVADSAGHWRVTLAPLPASAEPRALEIRGTNTLAFSDVLVGEVWFCSGQSNMEKRFGPRKGQAPVNDSALEVAAARYPEMRLFQIPRTDQPQEGPGKFHWLACSPETLRTAEFSATAYYFGRQVHQVLGVPVGLVQATFGGTVIDAWLPPAAFAEPPLQGLDHRQFPAKGPQPTELYTRMVAPYVPFAVRGFLWYQGETNLLNGDVALYGAKQTALIATWRQAWERPEAPFYGVLLAPMDYSEWEKFPVTAEAEPAFWEEQEKALSAPHTGYIVTTDLVSNTHDFHPTNKRDVGLRLAGLALAETYGRADIPAHGPTFASLRVVGDSLELTFDHAEGLRARDGLSLTGFTVSGKEQSFQAAQARLVDGKVVVTSPFVNEPVAVRFAWHEKANPNLVNEAGLPAAPFRTDDWPLHYLRSGPAETNSPLLAPASASASERR